MKNFNKEEVIDSGEVKRIMWAAFDILRNDHVPSDHYHVVLFFLTSLKDKLISVNSINNTSIKHELVSQLEVVKPQLSEQYNIIIEHYLPIIESMSANGLNKLISLIFNLDDFFIDNHFPEVFDKFLVQIARSQGKSGGEFMQPLEISRLMCKLADVHKYSKIFNPFAGVASFGVYFEENINYYGQEIHYKTWCLGALRLMAYGKLDSSTYLIEDSIESWPSNNQKFDLIITNPPLNQKLILDQKYNEINNSSVEQFLIGKGVESLSSNGKLITILPVGFLFRGRQDQALRKNLVDNDLIDSVILLPAGLLYNTSVATVVLVLNKNKKFLNKVKFVNAQNYFFYNGPREKVLDNYLLLKNLVSDEEIDGEIKFIDLQDIKYNDYNLNIPNYFFNPEKIAKSTNLDPSQQLVKLADILSNVSMSKATKGEIGKVIRIKNLSDDIFFPYIDISLLGQETLDKPLNKITRKAILLSKRFNNLKPSLIEATASNPVYISQDILAFEVPSSIDVNYLVWQLGSDFVKKQLEAFTTESVMASITTKNLLQIVIQLPSILEQQHSLFLAAKLQADKDKIVHANLQGTIDALIKDRFEEFQWDLHDIRNSELLAITQQAQVLTKIMERNSEVSQTIVDPKKNINLQDYIEKLLENTQALANKISTIYSFARLQEQFEEFDIVAFIADYMKSQEYLDLNQIRYELVTDNIQEFYELGLTIRVKFNKPDLERIMSNIVENVKRHASFNSDTSTLNKFSIVIEVPVSKQVKISFLNSGNRTEVTSSMYFSRDRKWGKTGNSGMGGYAIKKLANRNSAQVDIETFDEGEYVFGVNLLINREFEYVL